MRSTGIIIDVSHRSTTIVHASLYTQLSPSHRGNSGRYHRCSHGSKSNMNWIKRKVKVYPLSYNVKSLCNFSWVSGSAAKPFYITHLLSVTSLEGHISFASGHTVAGDLVIIICCWWCHISLQGSHRCVSDHTAGLTDSKAYHGSSIKLIRLEVVMAAAVPFKSEHFVYRDAHAIRIRKK